jgi:hypothetical protein
MKALLAPISWPRLLFLRSVRPTTTTAPVAFSRQWAAVNTLSWSIKLPPQLASGLPLRYSVTNATKGYSSSGTAVPPTIIGLTEAEEGCSSAACGAAPPLCTNTKKDTTIAATNAPSKVAHNGSLINLFTITVCFLLSCLGVAQEERC